MIDRRKPLINLLAGLLTLAASVGSSAAPPVPAAAVPTLAELESETAFTVGVREGALEIAQRPPAATKRVLVFGDSNTWGWIPVERGIPTTRYPADRRWPGVAQAALGDGFEIIEEGLSGRTTDLPDPDPTVKELSGAGLDGSAYLPAAVASHLPLDLVVIMLGTNDLKTKFDRSPEAIALGVRGLIEQVRRIDRGAWTEYPAPRVLVLAPPPLVRTERFPDTIFAGGIDKSRALASQLEAVSESAGAAFFDVGAITNADGVDGIHLSAAAHRRIGLAVADRIRAILE